MWGGLSKDEAGGQAVVSYSLQKTVTDSGFKEVVGESSEYLETSFMIEDGITAGEEYSFRVRAKN